MNRRSLLKYAIASLSAFAVPNMVASKASEGENKPLMLTGNFFKYPITLRFGEYKEWHPTACYLYWDNDIQAHVSSGEKVTGKGLYPVHTYDGMKMQQG